MNDPGDPPPLRHRPYEDGLALVTGTLIAALGMALYAKAGLIVGGLAGTSLLAQYATGIGFAPIFFAINLPFYALALRRMGWPYTLRTFAAVALLSAFVRLTPDWIDVADVSPAYAAVAGGALIGLGLLILFRHRAGLGGINILAAYLQDRGLARAGYVQLAFDLSLLVLGAFVLTLDRLLYSLAGAVVLNIVLAINHRPGRYVGVS